MPSIRGGKDLRKWNVRAGLGILLEHLPKVFPVIVALAIARMRILRRELLATALSAGLTACASEQTELRGYGKVTANVTPTRTVFACESIAKADLLLDKLQADLFWDKTLPLQKNTLKVEAGSVTVYSLPGYGAAVIARSGKQVLVLGGRDEAQVAAAAQEPLLKAGGEVTSQAAKTHPMYLDYYDIRAFKSYVPPMRSPRDFGLESHWPFLNTFGGSTAFFGPHYQFA